MLVYLNFFAPFYIFLLPKMLRNSICLHLTTELINVCMFPTKHETHFLYAEACNSYSSFVTNSCFTARSTLSQFMFVVCRFDGEDLLLSPPTDDDDDNGDTTQRAGVVSFTELAILAAHERY